MPFFLLSSFLLLLCTTILPVFMCTPCLWWHCKHRSPGRGPLFHSKMLYFSSLGHGKPFLTSLWVRFSKSGTSYNTDHGSDTLFCVFMTSMLNSFLHDFLCVQCACVCVAYLFILWANKAERSKEVCNPPLAHPTSVQGGAEGTGHTAPYSPSGSKGLNFYLASMRF